MLYEDLGKPRSTPVVPYRLNIPKNLELHTLEAWEYTGQLVTNNDPDWVAEALEPIGVCQWDYVSINAYNYKTRVYGKQYTHKLRPGDFLVRFHGGWVSVLPREFFRCFFEEVPEDELS